MKISKEEENRLKNLIEKPMIKPMLDFMVLRKEDKKTSIHLLSNEASNADVFFVQDVGPGYMDNGILVEPRVKRGDKVFIVGNIFNLKYNDVMYTLARAREVIAIVN